MNKNQLFEKHFFVFFLLITFATTNVLSQSTALPTAAQEAINKGIIAAKIPDYPLAIKYFEEARKVAPSSPEVFFNLGLAESKIPGRELRAIAWFGAYLTANPTTTNAAAVKEQIDMLVVRNQSNTSRFLKILQDAAVQLPVNNNENRKRDGLQEVSKLWAKTSDISAAINAANLNELNDRSYNYYLITEIQAESGDITGAQLTTDLIKDKNSLVMAKSVIAKGLIKLGDTTGAKKVLASAQEIAVKLDKDYDKEWAQKLIAETQGQISNAKQESTLYPDYRSWLKEWLEQLGIYDYGSTRGVFLTNLNQGIFLDLTASLNSLKASLPSVIAHEKEQMEIFWRSEGVIYFLRILEIGKEMVKGQNLIAGMLKEQARK